MPFVTSAWQQPLYEDMHRHPELAMRGDVGPDHGKVNPFSPRSPILDVDAPSSPCGPRGLPRRRSRKTHR